jgi:hypothetical protein
MRPTSRAAAAVMSCFLSCAAIGQSAALQSPQTFDSIADPSARSQALFVEAGKVIMGPRCQNCHPNGDRPTQADDMHLHLPMVVRGPENMGATALRCMSCHQGANFEPVGVPGNPKWHLAPLSMAWQGKSLGQICAQIKDTQRNGGRTLVQLQEHMGHDDLVGWAWNPGGRRIPAAGTHEQFGKLIEAWVATGAACPAS